MKQPINRGDIFYADLSGTIGSEQSGIRPVIVLQNDAGNKYSPTVIVAPTTSKFKKTSLPTHIYLSINCGLYKPSVVLLEQIRVIDKTRLLGYVGQASGADIAKIDNGAKFSLALV